MALIPWWIRYPNVNDEIMNLDWLLRVSNENTEKISNFINLNTIKYADPILWDITSQYEANTITVDPQTGDAYISTKAVPYGVSLSNTDYWTKIYNYADEINGLEEQIAAANEKLSTTATKPYVAGELVWLNGKLYEVTANMIAGDSFVENSNCKKTTIESLLGNLMQLASGDTNLVAAINGLKSSIDSVTTNIGSLENLSTEDKTSIVNAINEVYQMAAQVGKLSELTTEDKTSIVNAINEVARNLLIISSNVSTEFRSRRIFSFCDKHGAQFIAWTGSTYLLFNDTNSDGHITMTELNSSFQMLSVSELSVVAHPNGGWYHNGLIYLCDVNSPHIYVVDYTSKQLVKTIDIAGNSGGGCFYNGLGYFTVFNSQGVKLYTIDDNDAINQIGLLKYEVNAGMILQNIAIMNDIVYFVWNRPNCILRFDLNSLVQLKTMYLGDGDGYYPYGEIESLLLKENKLYMLSGLYYASGLNENYVTEFFETNIQNDSFVPKDISGYGGYTHALVYVDKNATGNNPNGSASNPFNNLTEASTFYQYNYNKYIFMGINIASGTYDDGIYLQSCNCEIVGNASSIKGLAIYGCEVYVRALTCSYISELRNCTGLLYALTFNANVQIFRSKMTIRNCTNIAAAESNINGLNNTYVSASSMYDNSTMINISGISMTQSTGCTVPLNALMTSMFANSSPVMITSSFMIVVSGRFINISVDLMIGNNQVNAINSGTTFSTSVTKCLYKDGKFIAVDFAIDVTKTSISYSISNVKNLTDNTAVNLSELYGGILKFEN